MRAFSILIAMLMTVAASAEIRRAEVSAGGLDCESCTKTIRSALMKSKAIESVEADNSKGLLVVTLKPGNKVSLVEIWEQMRRIGMQPKETTFAAHGSISGTPYKVKLAGTGETYELLAPEAMAVEMKRSAGKTVLLEGTVKVPDALRTPVPVTVKSIKPVS